MTFVVGTDIGWIQIWDLKNKSLIRRFRLVDPLYKKIVPVNMIRVLKMERAFITYNVLTRSLIITKVLRRVIESEDNDIEK